MYDMLIQGIGLIAFALFLLSYQVRSNRGLFAMQTLGNLLFALQFFLLGGSGRCGRFADQLFPQLPAARQQKISDPGREVLAGTHLRAVAYLLHLQLAELVQHFTVLCGPVRHHRLLE